MPDYSKGKIYAIRAPGTDDVYIGSTTKLLCQRMAVHRCQYKNFLLEKEHFREAFKMIEKPESYIELVESFPCKSKEELCKKEGEIIRNTPNCINKYVAGRTHSEYQKEHRDQANAAKRRWKAKKKAQSLTIKNEAQPSSANAEI